MILEKHQVEVIVLTHHAGFMAPSSYDDGPCAFYPYPKYPRTVGSYMDVEIESMWGILHWGDEE